MYLRENPFRVTPDEEFCRIWAGRRELRSKWETMLNRAIDEAPSRLYLVWGDYGAGKTHSLKHFKWFTEARRNTFTVYMEFTTDSKKFVDLYRQFTQSMDFALFESMVRYVWAKLEQKHKNKAFETLLNSICSKWYDFARATVNLAQSKEVDTIRQWICGGSIYRRELKQLGLMQNIETDFDAIRAMRCLVRLLTYENRELKTFRAVIWMIDEMQNLDYTRKDSMEKIMKGMKSVYDGCATNFCLILSFMIPFASSIISYIPEDLRKRLPLEYDIQIPNMNKGEAIDFVVDLLKQFRNSSENTPDDYCPFTKDSIERIIDYIQRTKTEIAPRDVMLHFQKILDNALREGIIKDHTGRIDVDFVIRTFG